MGNENKTIYDLKLHEELQVDAALTIQRVASGWNYIYFINDWSKQYGDEWRIKAVVFVPYDNESQTTRWS